jgi:ketosteroid isomerase-like protein
MAPPSPNVLRVQEAFDAFSRRDEAGLIAALHEDVVVHLPTADVTRGGEPYRGAAGISEYFADVAAVWNELRIELYEYHERDDLVVAIGRAYGWGGGRVVDVPTGWVWEMRDGRAISIRVFERPADALEAAGIAAGGD